MVEFLIEKVLDAALEASGLNEKIGRSEQIIRLKQRFGLEDIEALTKFEDIYVHAVVSYAFDDEGLCKPRELVEFFKLKEVRDVFQVAYAENDPRDWLDKGQEIAQHRLSNQLSGIDPRRELSELAVVFIKLVKQTRSPKEIRQEQKLDSLEKGMRVLQAQIQSLPSLEAINQLVMQLSSADQPMLPSAAVQNSEAAALARALGEWFDVLDYDRDQDYEVWGEDYFEWVIRLRLTRRKSLCVLVRGVAGEVSMADLKNFHSSMVKVNSDEGWLVGNRRVSKAARKAAQDQTDYEAITCYTFDELLDEDADFEKYLDWLEEQIKKKGVDVEYLPLACRKDDLDPVTQKKMGVSTYGEADGWIDGYVDMWLDDPAKEHLSVLGEFGTGKTWFSLHYAWQALQRYREAKKRGTERPRVPIVVPLRDYAKAVSVRSLFSEFFFDKHEMLGSYSVFEKLNRMGKLLLIFDGFDEMAARVNRQSMIDNFWELAKVVVPGAKAILTCRTEHFPEAIEGQKLLNAELKSSLSTQTGEPPQFEVLELEKFSDKQIATLMERKAAPETVKKVIDDPQLLDLARRPVMVDLILAALPDIEAKKPVDMARVYLYAVTRKMEKDIKSSRTFTSLADKLYFLCELSWEMLSTDRMSLNYRAFPEKLQQMFADRVKEEKELDHWRYDMMGQTMLIRNSEGDYSPAHRSLLEFFVAYKIVACLGAMAEDFTAVAQEQSHLDEALPSQSYTWDGYFKRDCDEKGEPAKIARLSEFSGIGFLELWPLLGQARLAKAVLDLASPMLNDQTMRGQLLPLLQMTAKRTLKESGYLGGNVAQMMLSKTPHALIDTDLRGTKLEGVDFTKTFLRRVNFQEAQLAAVPFSKVLASVNSVAYSPDGSFLAIGDSNGTLQVWDVATGKVVLFYKAHNIGINSVVYSPDGEQLTTGSSDKTVKIWNASNGDCIRTLKGHEDWVLSVIYSPDGKQLATGSRDKMVKVWNASNGDCIRTLKGHEDWVRSVVYSPDGQQLVTGSRDKTVRVWNASNGDCIHTLEGHKNRIWSVVYSPDGEQLATGSSETVKIWNASNGDCIRTLKGHKTRVISVMYSPDGKQLATGSSETVKIWNASNGDCIRTLEGHENGINSVVYSPDGKQLATGNSDQTVKIWNASNGDCIHTLEGHENLVWSVVYSPDGKQLATGNSDQTVKIWNASNGDCIHTLEGHENWVWSVVYSPDGKQLATGSSDKTVKVWNASNGDCIRTLKGHEDWVRSVVYSPDGQQLATGSYDKTVKVWNASNGDCIRTLKGHKNLILSVIYSPDGKQLATGSRDKMVKVWNASNGDCIRTLEGHEDWVRSVAYGPDGKQLATGSHDKTVKIWNASNGDCIHTLEGHEHWVWPVVYSPDGKQLATGSSDKTVKIWNASSGDCIRTLEGHENGINSVVYNPEGKQLATGSSDKTIRIWDVHTGKCLRIIDDRVCAGLNITGTTGLTPGQRTALKLMGAVDHNDQ